MLSFFLSSMLIFLAKDRTYFSVDLYLVYFVAILGQ